MKRSSIARKTPLRSKRKTPRRRPVNTFSRDDWEEANLILAARSGGLCERCGKTPWEHRHHRKRRRDGGDSLENLIGACSICHAWIHEHPATARNFGWIVAVTSSPVTVPMLWRSQEWVYLTEEGGLVPAFADIQDAHE